jgi:hypothetical protein
VSNEFSFGYCNCYLFNNFVPLTVDYLTIWLAALLQHSLPSNRHILFEKLNIFTSLYIHQSLFHQEGALLFEVLFGEVLLVFFSSLARMNRIGNLGNNFTRNGLCTSNSIPAVVS